MNGKYSISSSFAPFAVRLSKGERRELQQPASAFTLLEVLVALTILGLGVVTLLQIFSQGLRLGARSSAHTETVTAGARVMDELLARKTIADGPQAGRLGSNGRWSAQVQVVKDPGPDPAPRLTSNWELNEVTLEVSVNESGRERRMDLKTLRLTKKGLP